MPAPTTTSPSRSRSRSSHRCARCCGGSRRGPDDPDERLAFADMTMDLASREARRGDGLIELTRAEFNLLELFLRRPRRVLERSFILEEVWGFDFPTTANSLKVYVGYLAARPRPPRSPGWIHGPRDRLRTRRPRIVSERDLLDVPSLPVRSLRPVASPC